MVSFSCVVKIFLIIVGKTLAYECVAEGPIVVEAETLAHLLWRRRGAQTLTMVHRVLDTLWHFVPLLH